MVPEISGGAQALVDHVVNCYDDIDGVIVAQEGQIDPPASWVLVSTEVINGKRIRQYEIPEGS